jgi:hypothetical protein
MSNENILFYLTTCQSCHTFIKECQRLNILSKFKLVKVDDNINEFIKKGIQSVPTIYIVGMTNLIVGQECQKWIKNIEIVMNNNNTEAQTYAQKLRDELNGNVKKPPEIKNEKKVQQSSIMGFLQNEMTGISDNYAYKEDENAFPMSFQSKNYNFEIKTVPEKSKVSESATVRLINNAKLLRDADRNDFMKKFDEDYATYSNQKNPYFYAS